jgi:Ca2+-binding EF-hand superfamily protein
MSSATERPGDRFLSNYTSADLQMRTGFNRKEVATFHKHYLDCKEAVVGVTEEEKQEFMVEFGLIGDPTATEMLGHLDEECPMHFDEYLQALSFMRNKQGGKPARLRFVYQSFCSSDKGLNVNDLVALLHNSLPEVVMAKERAKVRILQLCKKNFKKYDLDGSGYISFKEFQALIQVDNNIYKAEDVEVDVPSVVSLIKQRRRQTALLDKLMANLMG